MTDKLRDAAQKALARMEQDYDIACETEEGGEASEYCVGLLSDISALRAALAQQDAQAVPQGWKPIQTAPRDGTNVLLRWGVDGVSQGHYIPGLPHPWKFIDTNDGITWLINHAVDGPGGPSHWMPMPDADVDTTPLKAADEFELRRLLEEERETNRQLTRALAEATEGPTFMGEPMLNAAPTPPAQRVMLTDDEIDFEIQLHIDPVATYRKLHNFARAVIEAYERKNGLRI